jgi:hypothetical protein
MWFLNRTVPFYLLGQRKWINGGIVGAKTLPILVIGIRILQEYVPYGSELYNPIRRIMIVISYPAIWCADMIGGHKCSSLSFLIVFFAAVLLYLVIIGFCIGAGFSKGLHCDAVNRARERGR